jgi:hypothetical protein
VVLSAFGGDALGAVLGSGAAPFGHHRAALAAVVQSGVGFWCGHTAGGVAQAGEQQCAARRGDIGLPRRRSEDHCAVGQLLITPAPKRFHQVVAPISENTLLQDKPRPRSAVHRLGANIGAASKPERLEPYSQPRPYVVTHQVNDRTGTYDRVVRDPEDNPESVPQSDWSVA